MPQRVCCCAEFFYTLRTIFSDTLPAIILNFKSFGGRANLSDKKNPLEIKLLLVMTKTVIDTTVCPKLIVCFSHSKAVCRMLSENNLNCCSPSCKEISFIFYNHGDFIVLGSDCCLKVTFLFKTSFYNDNETQSDLSGDIFFIKVFFWGKNICSRLIFFTDIIIDVMRRHNVIMCSAYIVTALHHHMFQIVVKFESELKVNCECFQCEQFWTLTSQFLYGGCNVEAVYYLYFTRCLFPADSQAVKLGRFTADEESLIIYPLVEFRDSYECTDGGRVMKGRVKPAQVVRMNPIPGFGGIDRRVVDRAPCASDKQDVWEEYKRPAVPEPFDDFEDFDDFMPSPPSLPFDLAEQ